MIKKRDLRQLGFTLIRTDENKKVFINESDDSRDEKIYFGGLFENKRQISIENNCGDFYFKGWLESKEDLTKVLDWILVSYKKDYERNSYNKL